MTLPFSHDEFLNVFAQYNGAFIWLAGFLWLVTLLSLLLIIRRKPAANIFLVVVLAFHWCWSGAVYHLVYFRDINPAAIVFGAGFILEGVLILWRGLVSRSIQFEYDLSLRKLVGIAVIFYGMFYPILSLMLGDEYPRMPLFAVPCPTVIITLGVLLLLQGKEMLILGVIPLAWSVIGGLAALLLQIPNDYGLIVAGMLFLIFLMAEVKNSFRS